MERLKVVGYTRFSSSNQREESITAQKRFISMYADNNNMEVIEWYVDKAKTGKTADRPQFQKLLNDVKNNPTFKAVIVHKYDRFSRNTKDTLYYTELFRDYGIEIFSVSENIDQTPAGKMLLTMMSSVNQYYVDNLSLEVMKGLKESARQGLWTGGLAPLGYDVVEQRLVINEYEAQAVKLIFEMSADGHGYGEIIDRLNVLGYKTKIGNSFGKNSLYEILQNERYKGTFIFNRRASSNSLNKRNNHRYKPAEEIIRIENGCPAIVSKELWERANAVRRALRTGYTNARQPYLLTGLLYCSCGAKFSGNTRTSHNGVSSYATYRCSARSNKHTCDVKEIRCDILDNWVIEQFFRFFFNESNIKVITEGLNRKIKDTAINDEQYISANNSLKSMKQSREYLIEAIAQTGTNEAITEKILLLEEQIKQTNNYIETYKNQVVKSEISEEDVKERIETLREYFLNPKNIVRTKYVLSQYIERIDISNETVSAIFKVDFAAFESSDVEFLHEEKASRKLLIKKYQGSDDSKNEIVRKIYAS